MKFKKLTKEQIIISMDRLTRFKHPNDKYMRVFCDIITANVTEPKYKKQELLNLPVKDIKNMAEQVINESLEQLKNDNSINNLIFEYENSIFNINKDTQELLNNNINYSAVINLLNKNNAQNLPLNIKWLISLPQFKNSAESREKYGFKYPIKKVVLVEGLTEELLLPVFAKYLGYDFLKYGIQIIPAGGKNQVVKMYYKLAEELKIPVFLLLDKDAESNIAQIMPRLRSSDKIHLITCGEFEDLLPKPLIVKVINKELNNFASITENELIDEIPEVKNLEKIFKEKGLHEYKKADFAKQVKDNINSDADISEEIRDIIVEISKL